MDGTQDHDMRSAPAPEIFVPLLQQTLNDQLFLLVRGASDARAMQPAVRQQIAVIDPDQRRSAEERAAQDAWWGCYPAVHREASGPVPIDARLNAMAERLNCWRFS